MGHVVSRLRSLCLPGYYYATWPYRCLAGSMASWLGRYPIAVLFYHRVADHTPTPWTISNGDFVRQIDWLVHHADVISLAEAQRRILAGRNQRRAVCITFDDGYAENCEHALPYLFNRGLPFTYFVATDYVIANRPFPHDVVRGQPLPPNSLSQLREIAERGGDIGAHTRTHADLGLITSVSTLQSEITGSRDYLEQSLGVPVAFFAFPYGQRRNLNSAAFRVAKEAGLAGVCSAYGGYNFPGGDAFHIQRLHGDPHFWRFQNWLTFDPRLAVATRRPAYAGIATESRKPSPVAAH